MIVRETERAEEKKEKQKNKQKQIIKQRKKNVELDSPNVASEMPWRCPLPAFFFDFVVKIVRG